MVLLILVGMVCYLICKISSENDAFVKFAMCAVASLAVISGFLIVTDQIYRNLDTTQTVITDTSFDTVMPSNCKYTDEYTTPHMRTTSKVFKPSGWLIPFSKEIRLDADTVYLIPMRPSDVPSQDTL